MKKGRFWRVVAAFAMIILSLGVPAFFKGGGYDIEKIFAAGGAIVLRPHEASNASTDGFKATVKETGSINADTARARAKKEYEKCQSDTQAEIIKATAEFRQADTDLYQCQQNMGSHGGDEWARSYCSNDEKVRDALKAKRDALREFECPR